MIKNKFPLFSIITCTYNRQELLGRAIQSVIIQTENNWELIVIDDGSTDCTHNLVDNYISSGNNIKYVFQENKGAALSKNEGMKIAKGNYITFLDSDDEYGSLHLENIRNYLLANPGIDFLYGNPTIIGNQYVPDMTNPGLMIHLNDCVIGGTFFIKSESLPKIGFYPDVKYGEDALLYENARKSKCNIEKINMPTYVYYRNNIDSLCNQNMGKK